MNRSGLKVLAGVLSASIAGVLFAGLDDLPRVVRKQIASERAALAVARTHLRESQQAVGARLAADAALFAGIPAAAGWPAEFEKAEGRLQSAARDMDELARLEKRNHRQDRARAESLLADERSLRGGAESEGGAVERDAAHWVELKQNLPRTIHSSTKNKRPSHCGGYVF